MFALFLAALLLAIGFVGWRFARRGHQFVGGTSLFYGGIFLVIALLLASDSLYQSWRNGPLERVESAYQRHDTSELDVVLKKLSEEARSSWFRQKMEPAVLKSRVDEVRYLLDRGARVDDTNREGTGWLFVALTYDVSEEMRCLLAERVQNVDGRGPIMETALQDAVIQRDQPVIRILVRRGASPELTDRRGQSALGLARGPFSDMLPLLSR